MKFWIARDEIGNLSIFKRKPYPKYNNLMGCIYWRIDYPSGDYMCLLNEYFPEVTFENSPQEVELKLVKAE